MSVGDMFTQDKTGLRSLLDQIERRHLALPDFQRDFVWEYADTQKLLSSLLSGYPAGTIMLIRCSPELGFACRAISGAPELEGTEPTQLILDGQQRLTSLYRAVSDVGTNRFFINLRVLMENGEPDEAVFYRRRTNTARNFGTIESQAADLVLPLRTLWRNEYDEWIDEILELGAFPGTEEKAAKRQLRELKNQLSNLTNYLFPTLELSAETPPSATCVIFESMNRRGRRLSPFDLLVARMRRHDLQVRDMWAAAIAQYPILSQFDVNPFTVFQALALLATPAHRAASCKSSDVLDLEVTKVLEHWEIALAGCAGFLAMLQSECGVLVRKWLPYEPLLIAGAAIWSKLPARGPEQRDAKAKLRRWFWSAIFTQAYDQGTNRVAARDFVELGGWLDGSDEEPTSVRVAAGIESFDEVLAQAYSPQSAVYRGVMAIVLLRTARDFHDGTPITRDSLVNGDREDHHIFPTELMKVNYSKDKYDCVLNRTLINRSTNRDIWYDWPSNYLGRIEEEQGREALNTTLDTHMIPPCESDSLKNNHFEDFMSERSQKISCSVAQLCAVGNL